MTDRARTPEPPYVAVIFTSVRGATDDGYAADTVELHQPPDSA